MWIVDLRRRGKGKYFSSTALVEAQIQRTRLRNEGSTVLGAQIKSKGM